MDETANTRLRAVILDIDGTLIDSNDAHAHAWMDGAAEFGHELEFSQVRPLIGVGGDNVLEAVIGVDTGDPEGARIRQRVGEIFRTRYLPELQPTNGARELLLRIKAEGLQCVAATSASSDDVAALLGKAGVRDLVEGATSAADVDRPKPAPDVVEAALERAGVRADEAVMLGDTPYDIRSAARAGVPLIALRCGGWWDNRELEGAVAIFDDPADVLTHYETLPLFRR